MLSWVLVAAASVCAAAPVGQIALISGSAQEDQRLCVLDLGAESQLPVGPGRFDTDPAWSPDGQWLAFATRAESDMAIAVVRADGSDLKILPHAKPWNRHPRWNASSTALTYMASSSNPKAPEHLCMVYDLAAGTETAWGGEINTYLRPVWMPNVLLLRALAPETGLLWGKEQMSATELLDRLATTGAIVSPAAVGERGKMTTDIFFVDPTNGSPLFRAALPNQGNYAEWAIEPNAKGTALAFESNDGGDREIFVFSKRGIGDVTNHRAADWNPVWSPDGQWLAFESLRDGRRGVYRVYVETARVLPVAVTREGDSWSPTWAPDGRWVAFVSNRTGDDELYAVSVETGGEAVQLTEHAGIDHSPVWRPKVNP